MLQLHFRLELACVSIWGYYSQPGFTCSNSTMKIAEQCMKSVQS